MPRVTVDSSWIDAIDYDEETGTLEIECKKDGTRIVFADVPPNDYEEFVSAPSIGQHYHQIFKHQHEPIG